LNIYLKDTEPDPKSGFVFTGLILFVLKKSLLFLDSWCINFVLILTDTPCPGHGSGAIKPERR
ncbi:MAG: hypothetical protein AAB302_00955, partial [Deltaproteobacteria bacterium]